MTIKFGFKNKCYPCQSNLRHTKFLYERTVYDNVTVFLMYLYFKGDFDSVEN